MTSSARFDAGVVLLALAACGFPTLSYESGDGGGPDGATLDGTTVDGRAGDASGDGASPGDAQDGSVSDAALDQVAPPGDGGGTEAGFVDAREPDGAVDCDQDKDGFYAEGPPCNGDDCCDSDPSAHPYPSPPIPWFTMHPDACGSWAYACEKTPVEQYAVTISCTGTGATGCSTNVGFMSDPGCGGSASLYDCTANGLLSCKPTVDGTQIQGCH
jgi:hypothetical protein